jgi:hypothetical protein
MRMRAFYGGSRLLVPNPLSVYPVCRDRPPHEMVYIVFWHRSTTKSNIPSVGTQCTNYHPPRSLFAVREGVDVMMDSFVSNRSFLSGSSPAELSVSSRALSTVNYDFLYNGIWREIFYGVEKHMVISSAT